ncbi:MAG: gliding motility-associated C-terminal domain-containing protein [Cyclobacteriaceae bacterium]
MSSIIFVDLLIVTAKTSAQNLVPNPSFEAYKELQCDLNRPIFPPYENPKVWFQSILEDWVLPTETPSQIFSLLLDDSCATNPLLFNKGLPKDGFNMVSIILTQHYTLIPNANARSYIQVKLMEKLKKNQYYMAGGYQSYSNMVSFHAANNLGMLFTEEAIGNDNSDMLKFRPQINENEVNMERLVWKTFGGCFQAKGNEQFLTIGGFYDDSETTVVQVIEGDLRGTAIAHYFIDSVYVEQVNDLWIPNVITPNGDGLNDSFVIRGLEKGQWSLMVYNKWGKTVYHNTDYRNNWSGEKLHSGVYFYLLKHRVCSTLQYKGTLTIIH